MQVNGVVVGPQHLSLEVYGTGSQYIKLHDVSMWLWITQIVALECLSYAAVEARDRVRGNVSSAELDVGPAARDHIRTICESVQT